MIIHEVEQRTDEWLNLKLGKFSGSNFGKLFMAKSTKGYNDLLYQIAYERLTWKPVEHHVTRDMEIGIEREPEARERYELLTFNKVREVGFVEHDDYCGISPDGLIGKDGGFEAKCPKFNTLIKLHITKEIDKNHYWQCQGSLWVTGRKWWDYFVYHPDLHPYIQRIERNEEDILRLQAKVKAAIIEVKKIMKKLS